MDETYPGSVDTDPSLPSDSPDLASSSRADSAGGQFASTDAGWNVPGVSKSSRFAANGAPQTEPIPTDMAAFVAGLAGACDSLLAVDMDAAPGCLPEVVEQLVVQQNRLAAVVCRFMAGLSTHGDPDTVGRFSASAWLQNRTRMSQAEAVRVAKVSSKVFGSDDLPRTRKELANGQITTAHAEEIARAADKIEPENMAKFTIEKLLIDVALTKPATNVKSAAQDLLDHLKPDTHDEDEKSDYDRRSLAAVSTFGNTVDIRGFGPGLEGQEVLDFFQRMTIAPQGPDDTRSKGQRCFDGFLDFIRTRADSQPSMGGFRPGIIVATEYSELMRELGRHTGQHIPDEPTIDDLRRIIAAHTGVHPDQILYNEEEGGGQDTSDSAEMEADEVDEDEIGKDSASVAADDANTREPANRSTSNATTESAENNQPADELRDINLDAVNRPPDGKSDVDKNDSRITTPRQRPAPPSQSAPPGQRTPPGPLGSPMTPPRRPNTGVRPSSSLPASRMPTWKEFIEAAERITDPNIRHLLNGAAATTAWAEVDHVSTRAPGTRTLNGHPVSAGTLRRLLCDAKVIPAIFDGRGQILDLGAAKRTFSLAQRRALILRDKHCRWKGCTMPHQYCEAHHAIPVEHHGPTNIDQAILLCCFHHHRSHEKNIDVLKHLDLPEPVRQLAAYYTQLQQDRRDKG